MDLWNAAGRWLVFAIGALLVILGGNAVWHGLDIIQVERGWAAVIAGTTALSAGILIVLIGVLIDRVDALRRTLLTQRAVQAIEAAPVPPSLARAEPEPPASVDEPIEVPVEVPVEPPSPPPSSRPGFSFRPFGRREPVEPVEPVPVETPAAPQAPVPPDEDLPPEPIRRFAPPQFRRPTIVPPPVPEVVPVPEPPPEPLPVAVEPPPPPPEAEVHLPRATPLSPLPPLEPEPEPEQVRVTEVQTPPAAEAAPPHRAIAETHAWLEKALVGDEPEPALDWLRQRRSGEERAPERRMPSFMRRHAETVEDAPPPDAQASAEEEAVAPAAEPAPQPTVVGRYTANGSEYTLFADGTIDAQTPAGPRHFANMAELRAFLESQSANA